MEWNEVEAKFCCIAVRGSILNKSHVPSTLQKGESMASTIAVRGADSIVNRKLNLFSTTRVRGSPSGSIIPV